LIDSSSAARSSSRYAPAAAFLLPWLGIHQIPLVGMAAVVLSLAFFVPIVLTWHSALPLTLSPADAKS
jgi:hypothetical protein